MLITTKRLLCFGKFVPAFHPIPSPAKWDKVALHSCLSTGWIKEVSESEYKRLSKLAGPPEPGQPKKKKRKVAESELEVWQCQENECERSFETKRALTIHKNRSHRS